MDRTVLRTEHAVAKAAYIIMSMLQQAQYVLLILVLAVNAAWFQILQSYMLLTMLILMCSYL